MTTKINALEWFEKEMGPMTFGTFLTAVRAMLDLSQSELARKLKVSRSMICDIEKGRVVASPALAVKIARAAGFPESFAVRCCLQDQLRRMKIRLTVSVA